MMYSKKDKYYYNSKFINDPIYGSIGLSKLEIDLINTKEFQRLRHLKQLSIANYVFPSGDHSRFSHSLGVLHIIGKMCSHLEKVSPEYFNKEHTLIMRIAALLHDIGHYPLSHLGERIYGSFIDASKAEPEAPIIKGAEAINYYSMHYICNKSSSTAHHEKLGQAIIRLSPNLTTILKNANIDPDEIASIIRSESENIVYCNLIHSACDADRIDYLIRDSFQTGVKFGMVDLDYLINLMRIVKYQKREVIAYDSKGQHVLEHFLMCRYFHYLQVVHNKTIGKFEAITAYLFLHMLKDDKFDVTGEQIKGFFDNSSTKEQRRNIYNSITWDRFTDYVLLTKLQDYCQNSDNKTIKLLHSCLIQRKCPATIFTRRELVEKNTTGQQRCTQKWYKAIDCIDSHLDKIAEELNIDIDCIGFKNSETSVHALPAYNSPNKKEDVEDVYKDAVKIIDTNNKVQLLFNDSNSIINVTSKYNSHFLNVFLATDCDDDTTQIVDKAKVLFESHT